MREITVEGAPLNVNAGRVKLTKDQARRRAHLLAAVDGKEGEFDVVRPIQFKVGETFGFEGDDKSLPIEYRPAEPGPEPTKAAAGKSAGKTASKAPVKEPAKASA